MDITSVRFCPECNNMLYPREDRSARQLLFVCKNCDHQEPATGYIVSRNDILFKGQSKQRGRVDLASDPTLPRTSKVKCPRCTHHQAVFFHERERYEVTPSLTLTFVCCNLSCNFQWNDISAAV